jgi:2-polyprenyl-3-methyl-5-hydroxy-6-metoxy-1,4-benzoquinol methylase
LSGYKLFDTRFGIEEPYEVTRCESCELEQTVPLPTGDELKLLYETYYNYGGEDGEAESTYVRLRKLLQNSWLWNLWLKIDGDISFHAVRGTGRLLDIGCNEGRGLIRYQGSGFSVEGLELNSKAAAAARNKGFVVYSDLIERFEPTEKYDVVVLSNVLEHSLNPAWMLVNVARILNPGGEVWISCPNSQSWLRSMFGQFWINWHVPFHISHFSVRTLAGTLRQSGFESIRSRQETPALWVSHSILASLFSKPGHVTKQLRSTMLVAGLMLLIRGLGFPLLWLGNRFGKGDCLLCVAVKR